MPDSPPPAVADAGSGLRRAIDSDLRRAAPSASRRTPAIRYVVGEDVGPYRVVERLALGGMATIFRAVHRDSDESVALKVLHPELAGSRDLHRRFMREARAIQRAAHPNIVEVLEVLTEGSEAPILVMEYLKGIDLCEYIQRYGPIAPARAVAIAGQICTALAALHEQHIIHRDLKPENIFVLGSDPTQPRIKLLDLGLAKKLASASDLNLRERSDTFRVPTPVGTLLGTPHYMSPEQIKGIGADYRADVYAVGVVLYEMLCVVLPFDSPEPEEVMRMHLNETAQPASVMLPDGTAWEIPPQLDQLLRRCLAKDPDMRFPSVAALRDALGYSTETTAQVHLDALLPSTSTGGTSGWTWAAWGTGAVLVLTLLVALLTRGS